MKFANPGWLWVLLVLPGLFWLMLVDERHRQRQFSSFAKQTLWSSIAPEVDPKARMKKGTLWLLAMAFILLALARPQWGMHEEVAKVSGLDIMLVVDVSNSMEVEDVVPSRLKKAKHLIRNLVERLQGDRVGLISFAGSAYVACPLTTDLEYLLESVQIAGPKMIISQGTDTGLAIETARRSLDRGSEDPEGKGENVPLSRAVILISDGEDQEERGAEAAAQLKESGAKLYVLGVGTQKGGPIPVRDEAGNLHGYKRDKKGQPVVSTFRPDDLMRIAAAGGGRYWNVTNSEGEIDELLEDVKQLNRTDYAERRYVVYEDRFQWPLFFAVVLILLEMGIAPRKIEVTKGSPTIALAVVFCLFVTNSASAWAESPVDSLETYTENRKGVQAFDSGNIDEAKKRFGSAQALKPDSPELLFNQGVVQMKEGDFDGAIRSFSDASRNPKLSGKSFYNLGGALTKKGDMEGAIRSYLSAIENAQRSQDAGLEEDARKNLQLLVQEMQKQKQKQQKDAQEDQSAKEKAQQQNQSESKSSQSDKRQSPQYQDNSKNKKQFKSVKLSDEDADRVMAEMKNRERELQTRLKRQNGNPQGNQKDW